MVVSLHSLIKLERVNQSVISSCVKFPIHSGLSSIGATSLHFKNTVSFILFCSFVVNKLQFVIQRTELYTL